MPRYFFDVHDGLDVVDRTGTELNGIDDAKREAVILAGSLLSELGSDFWNRTTWSVDIKDEGGALLFTLRFEAEFPS